LVASVWSILQFSGDVGRDGDSRHLDTKRTLLLAYALCLFESLDKAQKSGDPGLLIVKPLGGGNVAHELDVFGHGIHGDEHKSLAPEFQRLYSIFIFRSRL